MTRSLAPWLGPRTPPLIVAIVTRAMKDIGICEMPLGSNRSGRIDEYNNRAGVPLGSYWCASGAGAWWAEASEEVNIQPELPPGYASVDHWVTWARKTRRWGQVPLPGCAVIYGTPTDADHIGVIIRATPALYSVEGNTTAKQFDRNGTAIWPKSLDRASPRILGYVHPMPIQ